MKKGMCAVVLMFCISSLWASPEEIFEAGSFEFGGELNLTYMPNYYITDSEDREANGGEYDFMVIGSGTVGFFPVDRLSIQLMPGLLYYREVYDNGDDVYHFIQYLLELGTDYYFTGAFPWVFSPGVDAGIGLMLGLDGKNNGETEPDESLDVVYTLEPKLSIHYFVSDRVAPYISIAPVFQNYREIKSSDGSPYDNTRDFMKNWRMQLRMKIGVKYFLPHGARFFDKKNLFAEVLGL
jgi:hypothetical protein